MILLWIDLGTQAFGATPPSSDDLSATLQQMPDTHLVYGFYVGNHKSLGAIEIDLVHEPSRAFTIHEKATFAAEDKSSNLQVEALYTTRGELSVAQQQKTENGETTRWTLYHQSADLYVLSGADDEDVRLSRSTLPQSAEYLVLPRLSTTTGAVHTLSLLSIEGKPYSRKFAVRGTSTIVHQGKSVVATEIVEQNGDKGATLYVAAGKVVQVRTKEGALLMLVDTVAQAKADLPETPDVVGARTAALVFLQAVYGRDLAKFNTLADLPRLLRYVGGNAPAPQDELEVAVTKVATDPPTGDIGIVVEYSTVEVDGLRATVTIPGVDPIELARPDVGGNAWRVSGWSPLRVAYQERQTVCKQEADRLGQQQLEAVLRTRIDQEAAKYAQEWRDVQLAKAEACAKRSANRRQDCADELEKWVKRAGAASASVPAGSFSVQTTCGAMSWTHGGAERPVSVTQLPAARKLLAQLDQPQVAPTTPRVSAPRPRPTASSRTFARANTLFARAGISGILDGDLSMGMLSEEVGWRLGNWPRPDHISPLLELSGSFQQFGIPRSSAPLSTVQASGRVGTGIRWTSDEACVSPRVFVGWGTTPITPIEAGRATVEYGGELAIEAHNEGRGIGLIGRVASTTLGPRQDLWTIGAGGRNVFSFGVLIEFQFVGGY